MDDDFPPGFIPDNENPENPNYDPTWEPPEGMYYQDDMNPCYGCLSDNCTGCEPF